jgi:hypothetical protein
VKGTDADIWKTRMLSTRLKMVETRREWLVELVAEMREAQKAPPVLVRSGKRKAAERAVDRYIEAYKGKEI